MKAKPAQQKSTKSSLKVRDLKPKANPVGGDKQVKQLQPDLTTNTATTGQKAAAAADAILRG